MPAWTEQALTRLEHRSRQHLLRERWLRWHVSWIALVTLLGLMAIGAVLRWLGVETLAVRYALTLPLAYLFYLGVLRCWAGMLARGAGPDLDANALEFAADMAQASTRHGGEIAAGARPPLPWQAGGGGDFGGAGAQAAFDADGCGISAELGARATGSAVRHAAGHAAAHASGEGSAAAAGLLGEGLALLPLIVGVLLAASLGLAVLALFGVDVLLAVSVEVLLAAVAGSLSYQRLREGWLPCAVRLTWRGALAVLVLGVALGAAIDHWLPEADSLPQALRMLRHG